MTDRDFTEESTYTKTQAALLEIAQAVQAIEALQTLTAHLEKLQTASETDETRSVMLSYHDIINREIAGIVRGALIECT